MKGLLFFLASSCILASVVLPNALGAGGGKTIASAPTLRVGVRVGDSHKLPGCSNSFTTSGYGEIWRIPLRRGDQLRLVYGSKDSNPVQITQRDVPFTIELLVLSIEGFQALDACSRIAGDLSCRQRA